MQINIMQGIAGSGKSTLIQQIIDETYLELGDKYTPKGFRENRVIICSADHYFEKLGKYNFNPNLLGLAHKECYDKYIDAINNKDFDLLFVDNTNTRFSDLLHYYEPATKLGHRVKIICCCCSIQTAFYRNTHKVPLETIQRMYNHLNSYPIPSHWNFEVFDTENYNNFAG